MGVPNEDVDAKARVSVFQSNSAKIFARVSAEEEERRRKGHGAAGVE
ncbi:MAG TPA: hypothetical protein VF531_13940 [Bacillota bacterium]